MARKLTDLSGDGRITQKDVLIGRGVIKAKAGTLATKAKAKIKKVASKLTKASKAHAGQAKTLNKVVKAKKGLLAKKSTGSAIPSNPKLYAAVKAEAKRKFDVYLINLEVVNIKLGEDVEKTRRWLN